MIEAIVAGSAYFAVSKIIVCVGICIAADLHLNADPRYGSRGFAALSSNWDGVWYREIAEKGYRYERTKPSNIAFFPAYPLTGRLVAKMFGCSYEASLTLVSGVWLLAAAVMMGVYARIRARQQERYYIHYVLLAFTLLPPTGFFHMAYSESLFVLATIVTLYGIARRWPAIFVAALVGLATATRPVGIALVPVLGLYAWRRSGTRGLAASGGLRHHIELFQRLMRCAAITGFGCWGIAAFVAYQWHEFGDPCAFAKTQAAWVLRAGDNLPLAQKALAQATLEPIWEVYVPSRPDYWAKRDQHGNPLLSMHFANPIWFMGTVAVVLVGWRKKWLTAYELLLAASLLLIPYITKSHDNAMASFGRFSAVVVPAYIVIGKFLARLPSPLAAAVIGVSSFFLGLYAALFAAGYRII